MPGKIIEKYMRIDKLPHIWCPGCGNGILLQNVLQAVDYMCNKEDDPWDRDEVIIVSGIGCSSRAVGYMDFGTIHTTHGRAIAFATGVKMAKPHLHVIVLTGDGDSVAIGGNHLIHVARRNIDLTVVVFNNDIYGMTGGQYSPTTPLHDRATTAPYGVIDKPFNIAQLAMGAGATYVAVGDTYHVLPTRKLIRQGLEHHGFAIIDCYTDCPTYYGRKNHKGSAPQMLEVQKETGVLKAAYDKLSPEEREGKYVIGVLMDRQQDEYSDMYAALRQRAIAAKEK